MFYFFKKLKAFQSIKRIIFRGHHTSSYFITHVPSITLSYQDVTYMIQTEWHWWQLTWIDTSYPILTWSPLTWHSRFYSHSSWEDQILLQRRGTALILSEYAECRVYCEMQEVYNLYWVIWWMQVHRFSCSFRTTHGLRVDTINEPRHIVLAY